MNFGGSKELLRAPKITMDKKKNDEIEIFDLEEKFSEQFSFARIDGSESASYGRNCGFIEFDLKGEDEVIKLSGTSSLDKTVKSENPIRKKIQKRKSSKVKKKFSCNSSKKNQNFQPKNQKSLTKTHQNPQKQKLKFSTKKSKKISKSDQKYPGITFLKSKKIPISEKLENSKEILNSNKLNIEEEKRLKRKVRRQTRREKERLFRHNLETAFDLRKIEIQNFGSLPKKIDKMSFQSKGKLSDFPLNFEEWVSGKKREKRGKKKRKKKKKKGLEKEKGVFGEVKGVLDFSQKVNSEGSDAILNLIDSLKEIDYINKF